MLEKYFLYCMNNRYLKKIEIIYISQINISQHIVDKLINKNKINIKKQPFKYITLGI